MARVLICEPVEETRELIECLVQRMGHEIVSLDSLRLVDVLFYEPASHAGLALARRLQAERPGAALVSCSASPPSFELSSPRPFASLLQPFAPADLKRVLEAALGGVVPVPA
ncbi:MAG: response regulator receiver protein [Solirubrobacteraceae bacterium]|nr:response regulator receiver protein [Solirubrobacteraceae bacterium]